MTTLYYIEQGSGNLCSVGTDGQGRQVLVSDTVEDYQFRSDRGWFLYRDGANNLCRLRKGEDRPQLCWKTDQRFTMDQVACNPDGTVVAYLDRVGDLKPFELVLYDAGSDRVVRTGVRTNEDDYDPEVAWSDSPDILFLKHNGKVETFQVQKDLSVAAAETESPARKLLAIYGRFKEVGWWRDSYDGEEAVASPWVLGSHLSIKDLDGATFVLAVNPGLLHLFGRGFCDVCFVADGKELIFDDYRDIYLLDVNERKVGWVAHGSKLVTVTARYQRKIAKGKK